MFQKKKLILILIITISILLVQVNALDSLVTGVPLYKWFGFMISFQNMYIISYDTEQLDNADIHDTGLIDKNYYRGLYYYTSNINASTFYHYQIILESNYPSYTELQTGYITPDNNNGFGLYVLPTNFMDNFSRDILEKSLGKYQLHGIFSMDNFDKYRADQYSGVSTGYYLTKVSDNKIIIDCVFSLTQEAIKSINNASRDVQVQSYVGINYTLPGKLTKASADKYNVSDKPLYDKLDEIIANLVSQASGGLSQEQVQAAVEQALNNHDSVQEQEGNRLFNSLKGKFDEITKPYTESMARINNVIKSYGTMLKSESKTAVLYFPAATNPITGDKLWDRQSIDLAWYWNQLPVPLQYAVSTLLTVSIWLSIFNEMRRIINSIIFLREETGTSGEGLL